MHRLFAILALLVVTPIAAAAGGPMTLRFEPVVTVPDRMWTAWYTIARTPTTTTIEQRGPNGDLRRHVELAGQWALPYVTDGHDDGISADGTTLVLAALPDGSGTSRFVAIETAGRPPAGSRPPRYFELKGTYAYDAIAPDGTAVYVIRHRFDAAGAVVDYTLHRLDTSNGELDTRPIVDPAEADEPMTGTPTYRVSDGNRVFTLYEGEKPFVHALDTVAGTARCIDLEGMPAGFGLKLEPYGRRGGVRVVATGSHEVARLPLR